MGFVKNFEIKAVMRSHTPQQNLTFWDRVPKQHPQGKWWCQDSNLVSHVCTFEVELELKGPKLAYT